MSGKSSSSPTLRLQTGSSRTAVSLVVMLALAAVCAFWQLWLAGHYALALVLLLPVVRRLLRLAEAARRPLGLAWRAGQWYVLSAGCEHAAQPRHSVLLPWVVVVALRTEPDHENVSLWIFSDAVDRESLRRLRVRLLLSR
ncbi:MAG: hypothetical protein KDI09_00045 [Halioglobus sp.]|nr:hypothetical protein [Halioglobus sp.]